MNGKWECKFKEVFRLQTNSHTIVYSFTLFKVFVLEVDVNACPPTLPTGRGKCELNLTDHHPSE